MFPFLTNFYEIVCNFQPAGDNCEPKDNDSCETATNCGDVARYYWTQGTCEKRIDFNFQFCRCGNVDERILPKRFKPHCTCSLADACHRKSSPQIRIARNWRLQQLLALTDIEDIKDIEALQDIQDIDKILKTSPTHQPWQMDRVESNMRLQGWLFLAVELHEMTIRRRI